MSDPATVIGIAIVTGGAGGTADAASADGAIGISR